MDWIELLSVPLIQNMFIAGMLASLVCGVIGTFVVVKRVVFASGGIAHTTFGGVGFAYWPQSEFALLWFDPLLGAALFAVTAGLIMSLPNFRRNVREDSTIGILWVAGMALGVLFLQYVDRSKVYVIDPESILFGNILLVDDTMLVIIAVLVVLVIAVCAALFRDLQIMTFDEEFAEVVGVRVNVLNVILYTLIAITTVILINIVGIVMVLAMLTIPASIAGLVSKDLGRMMLIATIGCAAMTLIGLMASLAFDLPPSAPIVLVMSACLVAALWVRKRVRVFRDHSS